MSVTADKVDSKGSVKVGRVLVFVSQVEILSTIPQRPRPESGLKSWEALLSLRGIRCNLVKQFTEAFTITVFLHTRLAIWRQSEAH